jgi:hypothetical protein
LIIIFTDGCISDDYGAYKKYDNKTLWVIDGGYNFKPLFGKVAKEALRGKK